MGPHTRHLTVKFLHNQHDTDNGDKSSRPDVPHASASGPSGPSHIPATPYDHLSAPKPLEVAPVRPGHAARLPRLFRGGRRWAVAMAVETRRWRWRQRRHGGVAAAVAEAVEVVSVVRSAAAQSATHTSPAYSEHKHRC